MALRLGFGEDDFGYAIDLGLPVPGNTAFGRDPVIKRECVWTGPLLRPSAVLCDRLGGYVKVRDDDGDWSSHVPVREYDSMLSEFADPQRAPECSGCGTASGPVAGSPRRPLQDAAQRKLN